MRFFILLLFLFIGTIAYGQSKTTAFDSLYLEGRNAFSDEENYEKAISIFQKILTQKFENIKDEDTGKVYRNIGLCYENLEKPDSVIFYMNQAIPFFLKSKKSNRINAAKSHIADAASVKGDYHQALQQYYQLIQVEENSDFLRGIGFCYQDLNQPDSAIYYFKRELYLRINEDDDRASISKTYGNIANSYDTKNQLDSALHFHQLSLKFHNKEDKESLLDIYNNISVTSKKLGDYPLSLKQTNNALALCKELYQDSLSNDFAAPYDNLANVLQQQGKIEESLLSYQKALQYTFVNFKEDDYKNNPNLETNSLLGEWDDALTILHDKAEGLMAAYYETNQGAYCQTALETYQLASDFIDKMRFEQSSQKSKFFWRDKTKPIYEGAIESAIAAQNSTQAFFFFEKSKAVLLADALRQEVAEQLLPVNLATKKEKLLTEIQDIELGLQADFSNSSLVQQKIEKAKELHSFLSSLEKKYPSYFQFRYNNSVVALADVKKKLQSNEAIIHYFLGDEAIFAMQIDSENQQLYQLPRPKDFNEKVNTFVQNISDVNQSNSIQQNQISHELYQLLIQPLKLDKEKLTIIPEGLLYYIPFSALLKDKQESNSYLLHDFVIRYAYSLGILNYHQNKTAQNNNELLAIAPITFNSNNLVELEHSKTEVQNILTVSTGKALLREAATKKAVVEHLPLYQIIHASTHATANIQSDKEPSIYLYDKELLLSEIYELSLNADLVVLSACETAQGDLKNGEGVMSLARGFAYAGVPAILTTLWEVNDRAIAEISQAFYQYLKEGKPKDEALCWAQRDYLKTHQNSITGNTPYYWSSLILVGNKQNLKLKLPSNTGVYFSIFLLISLAIVLGFKFFKKSR